MNRWTPRPLLDSGDVVLTFGKEAYERALREQQSIGRVRPNITLRNNTLYRLQGTNIVFARITPDRLK